MKTHRLVLAAGAVLLLLVSACGGSGSGPKTLTVPAADVATLGGQPVVDELTKLYAAATAAGQDTVTVYGPGENDRAEVYKLFAKRFPGITVKGEFLVGADLIGRVNQEFASGKHTADVAQNGDTTAAAMIKDKRFVPFTPVSATGLPADFTDGNGFAFAASALAFGPAYNTDKVTADQAPKSWSDLLDPKWKGRMVMENPTTASSTSSAMSHLLFDGRQQESFVTGLAAAAPRLSQNAQAAGTSLATGEYDLDPIYPYSFYLRNKAQGAKMGFVFPVQGGNHMSAHFLSLIDGAPNPDAAKLFMTWMFTPEAQQALAGVGQWGTMPSAPGPQGFPALTQLDLLKPFPLDQVGKINNDSIARFKTAFAAVTGS